MLPDTRRAAVDRALTAAFGTTHVEDMQPLAGGLSTALVFKIIVAGAPYLLRVTMRTDVYGDPTRQFACMRAGAAAGIAPAIRYAGIEDRVLISDFVERRPWPPDAATRVARAIRILHDLPRFAPALSGDYFDTLHGVVTRLRTAALLPPGTIDELERGYDAARAACGRRAVDQVASHNDLKPSNMVFDGERVWFVDWEAAFANDRHVDLSVAANFFVDDEGSEDAYLSAYFGAPVTEDQRARFFLVRQILHTFYAGFLLLSAQASEQRHAPEPLPEFRSYHARLLADDTDLKTLDGQWTYGLVHVEQALRGMRSARFAGAVAHLRA